MTALGFIGAGPVGTAFAVNLSRRGQRVAGVFDVRGEAARRLAGEVAGCQVFDQAQALVEGADLVFITTPDDFIAKVTGELRWRPGQAAVHCSGATTVEALEAARAQGALAGAIHPCQSFAGREQAIANLPGATFAIEAEEPLRTTLTAMAKALDGEVVYLTSEDKALYHAAACIVSNYAYTLADIATDLWASFGKSKAEATKAYIPLLRGTVSNIESVGFPGCPTGPILRGDVKTIERHFAALAKHAPDILPLYKALGLRTIPLGLAKGTLSEVKAAELRSLLARAD